MTTMLRLLHLRGLGTPRLHDKADGTGTAGFFLTFLCIPATVVRMYSRNGKVAVQCRIVHMYVDLY